MSDVVLLFGVFLALLLGGMWIPFAIGVAAMLSLVLKGGTIWLKSLGVISWGAMENFSLTAVPLFVLMAEIIVQTGLSLRIYRGLSVLVRRLPGGLLQTNIASCGIFAAISGSSVATAAAIGTVALPQLKSRGYGRRLSLGSLAAGGTLGILIPPSVAMIIYGTFTQTSIAKLFVAGVLPGLLMLALFMLYIGLRALLRPDSIAEPGQAIAKEESEGLGAWRTTVQTAADLLPFVTLIALVIGSLYLGWATPTESGAIGVVGAAAIAGIWAKPTFADFWRSLVASAQITGSVLFIVYSAFLFSYAINLSGLPKDLTAWLVEIELSPIAFLIAIFLLYTFLGCIMDSLGMIVITIPLLLPVILQYGIDPIWFGVALVVLIELGQITPPLGLNLFVVQGISGAKLSDVVRGTLPFYFLMILVLALLTIWPEIALWMTRDEIGRASCRERV